ncbi:hypothetical protein M3Y99_00761700 [Aphelenchoides fujianensis]|nr:hypothetical protein M3Y99_00761700 [Aphelenchoides fujianensis]
MSQSAVLSVLLLCCLFQSTVSIYLMWRTPPNQMPPTQYTPLKRDVGGASKRETTYEDPPMLYDPIMFGRPSTQRPRTSRRSPIWTRRRPTGLEPTDFGIAFGKRAAPFARRPAFLIAPSAPSCPSSLSLSDLKLCASFLSVELRNRSTELFGSNKREV